MATKLAPPARCWPRASPRSSARAAPRRASSTSCTASGGTRFEAPPDRRHESSRKLWIGLAELARGPLTLDEGACAAVIKRGASVLPVGVIATEGAYAAGDVVNVVTPEGTLIGRGVCRYSADEMVRVRGLSLDVIERFMPEKAATPAIHRDELLVF